MAILWPRGTLDEAQPADLLRRALGHAVSLVEGGAGVLALSERESESDGLVVWGIGQEDARFVVATLRQDAIPESLDGRPRISTLSDVWAGEVAMLTLRDAAGNVGTLHLLGRQGFSTRRPLADPPRRQALTGMLVTAVRAQREADRLRTQNQQMSSILHFSGDGIVTVDPELRITGFNPAMEEMTSWRDYEVFGKFYYDVLRPHDPAGNPLPYARDPLVRAVTTGTSLGDQELILLARDGERVNVSVTAAAARDAAGALISGVLNVRDITRSRETEELRSTFISVVSHELQTPIAIIKGYASTLAREDAHWDADILHERLTAIEEEADRLSHQVGNLLYASRIQAGGLAMERGEMDLAEVTRSVVTRFGARNTGHEISVRLPSRMPLVLGDRGRIEEVLLNLLDNAAKYSPRGGRIRVRGRVGDHEVRISIADDGQGIPLREQERIFARFQRVENTASRRTQGAGLGLYICRAIVEAHGGRIWVESALGHGSTFGFALPLAGLGDGDMLLFGGAGEEEAE
ncbi:MAG TPA: ATP-binding protein [Ktedonobacterales bacterium]